MADFQRREDKERIIKFILCSILGLCTGKLIGYPNTPTIAVSAILMLYIDRGYSGSLKYNLRRITVQLVMGGVAFVTIMLLKAVTPLENWIIGIITTSIAIAIGLPLHYCYQIAPLTVTVGNAALIMVTGILVNPLYYPERVLFCVLGAFIAVVVNYGVMPQMDRHKVISEQLISDAGKLFEYLQRNDLEPGKTIDGKGSIEFLKKHIGTLSEDSKWKKYCLEHWAVELAKDLLAAQERLLQISTSLVQWNDALSVQFREKFLVNLEPGIVLHKQLLEIFDMRQCQEQSFDVFLPNLPALSCGEVILASDLLHYFIVLNEAKKICETATNCRKEQCFAQ